MAATLFVHATGLVVLLRVLGRLHTVPPTGHWPTVRMLVHIIWWLILLHLVEISIWGAFYLWRRCLPDAETAFYFSGVTYTTLGYGDVVLAKPWRLLAPIEGLAGILMFSLSTGYFFLVVSYIHQSRHLNAGAIPKTDRAEQ